MDFIIQFIINNWAAISAIVAAIGLRLFPTEKNYDIFSKILKLLDLIVPNLKKGGGRHVAKVILFFVLVSVSANSFAQLNTRTRQIRFATVFQASDTAETSANAGRVWYDFITGKFRCNIDGTNSDLVGGGSGGAFWPLSGTGSIGTAGAVITANDNVIHLIGESDFITTFGEVKISGTESGIPQKQLTIGGNDAFFTDSGTGTGLSYSADYSTTFTDRSLADWGNVWKIYGTSTQPGATAQTTTVKLNTDVGSIIQITDNDESLGLIVQDGAAKFANAGGSIGVTETLVDITGNVDLTPNSSASEIFSGTYTPTATNIANATSILPVNNWLFTRVGSNVTVSGLVTVTSTSVSETVFRLSLPVASNFTGTIDAVGTMTGRENDASSITQQPGSIIADTTNDEARINFLPIASGAGGAVTFSVIFQYIIK